MITKYGAVPAQVSKTAQGSPGKAEPPKPKQESPQGPRPEKEKK